MQEDLKRRLIPMDNRIILKKIMEKEQIKSGSLIIPSSMPTQDRYEVFDCGSSTFTDGEIVYIDKYKGIEVTFQDEKYLIVHLDDIIAFEGWPK